MRGIWITLSGAALMLAIMGGAGAQEAHKGGDPFLPEGEGREKVEAVCTACHTARTFAQLRYTAPGWRYHVKEMALHGAQIPPEDIGPIVEYLSTVFGPGVPLPGPAPKEVTLTDGPGKELVEGTCALCHGLDRVTAAHRSEREWNAIIAQMVRYGAPLEGEDRTTATAYLQRYYGAR